MSDIATDVLSRIEQLNGIKIVDDKQYNLISNLISKNIGCQDPNNYNILVAIKDLKIWESVLILLSKNLKIYDKIQEPLTKYIKNISHLHNQFQLVSEEKMNTEDMKLLLENLSVKKFKSKWEYFAHYDTILNGDQLTIEDAFKSLCPTYYTNQIWRHLSSIFDFTSDNHLQTKISIISMTRNKIKGFPYQIGKIELGGYPFRTKQDIETNTWPHERVTITYEYVKKLSDIDLTKVPFRVCSIDFFDVYASDGKISDLWDFLIKFLHTVKFYVICIDFNLRIHESPIISYFYKKLSYKVDHDSNWKMEMSNHQSCHIQLSISSRKCVIL